METFWNNFFSQSTILSGTVPASSLLLSIYSTKSLVFQNAGGIELVGKIDKFSNKIDFHDELFTDSDDIERALKVVLYPFFPK